MTKAKQTLDQYNQTREEGRDKLQPLFDEKNKKREALKINLQGATDQENKTAREFYKSQSQRLNESRKVLNADLISKYQKLYQQKNLDEATFQRGLEEFRKGNPEIDEQALRDLFMGKLEKKESKETMKKPQLESENHKIDQGKSKEEKLAEGWKEEERPAYINGSEKKIKVLKKELAPGAFVREYQDDGEMPKHFVGEQLFNWQAVLSLGLKNRLPTWDNMVAMRGETIEGKANFLKNNFQKNGKNLFPGYWNPYDKKFHYISKGADCWLASGYGVGLSEGNMDHYNSDYEFGFSLRLLKN